MPEWKGSTYGSNRLHKMLVRLLSMTDVRLIYLISAVCVIPVCLIRNPSGKIIYRFMRKRIGCSRIKAAWKTYQNHCLFGQLVIDRFATYAGKKFHIDIVGDDIFAELANRKEPLVIMSSHLGNYEIAGYYIRSEKKRLNAVMYGLEKTSVMENRANMFSPTNVRIIPVTEDMEHVFLINEAIHAGEIISFPSDRIFGSGKTIKKTFLGAEADFPIGPLAVATMNELSVIAINVVKTGLLHYTATITPLRYTKSLPRRQQMEELSGAYIAELERIVRKYPEQWYNYYNFWNTTE